MTSYFYISVQMSDLFVSSDLSDDELLRPIYEDTSCFDYIIAWFSRCFQKYDTQSHLLIENII